MGKLSEYIQEQAKKKGKTPESWLRGVLENFSKCTLATHVGKFSNPDSRVIIYDESETQADGLVTTASCSHEVDMIYSSAAYMAAAKLLLQPLEDGKAAWNISSPVEVTCMRNSNLWEWNRSGCIQPFLASKRPRPVLPMEICVKSTSL